MSASARQGSHKDCGYCMNTDDEGEWTVDWKLWGVSGWSRGQCGAWLSVYHCLRQQRAT